ncbi:MAG TPA: BMP family ABC transporter substrate-binding protein [Firmicutes bacterium]|nr:BMP family ABC transporter substrate-binding protein [Bacillota bacterium]
MKKCIKLAALSLIAFTALAGCDNANNDEITVGLIALHDENSTYDKNFIDAFNAACKEEGVKGLLKTGVPETIDAYEKATDLVESGCKFVFADSFGHEDHILKAAKENPDVQFSHASGNKAHTANVSNFHNAFASIYEGRYLAGVAAGMKLKSMVEADATTSKKIGYVGAFTYAEVISGYTSYFLGVRSIVSDVTMDVTFTGSWYDEAAEKTAAETLISNGCSIISQHADSWGAPTACETANVPNISYNGSTESRCPNTFVVSSKINWEPYFRYCFQQIKAGKSIDTDWTGELGDTLYDGSVALSELGKKGAAEGTEDKLKEVAGKLRDGSLKVFDTSTFTVSGENVTTNVKVDAEGHLTSYKADVDFDAAYTHDTEVIETKNGKTYFAESEKRSAPYFDVQIDGITLLNSK